MSRDIHCFLACFSGQPILSAGRAVVLLLLSGSTYSAAASPSLVLTGQATLRPQNTAVNFGATHKTILLEDDGALQLNVQLICNSPGESSSFVILKLQRRSGQSSVFADVHTFFDYSGTPFNSRNSATQPTVRDPGDELRDVMKDRNLGKPPDPLGEIGNGPSPEDPNRPPKHQIRPVVPTAHEATTRPATDDTRSDHKLQPTSPAIPSELNEAMKDSRRAKTPSPFEDSMTRPTPTNPNARPQPDLKTGPPFRDAGVTVTNYCVNDIEVPAGLVAYRAIALTADASSPIMSEPVLIEHRPAPRILTLLSMGGWCGVADGNSTNPTLEAGGITRNQQECQSHGIDAAWIDGLTISNSNCNDLCDTTCINFLEHLALHILSDRHQANVMDCINDHGDLFCGHRDNPLGIHNHIFVGKWRNTKEEGLCGTPITFNQKIDDFVNQGGHSLILLGQSLGGFMFARMVRDNWRWGEDLRLELMVLWDATGAEADPQAPPFPNSNGVRRVGPHPRKVLSFFQYSSLAPFQNGAPMDPNEPHENLEQHDLNKCFSHNGIARSQLVHTRTTEVVQETIRSIRDQARQ